MINNKQMSPEIRFKMEKRLWELRREREDLLLRHWELLEDMCVVEGEIREVINQITWHVEKLGAWNE